MVVTPASTSKRTRRTLRHIDPWSVLKVSILLYACLYGATVLAGYLLWTAAVQSGVISNIESFIAEVGSYEVWEINGEEVFRRATVIGGSALRRRGSTKCAPHNYF